MAGSLLAALTDLIFGSACAGCADVGASLLCETCTTSLAAPARVVRPSPCPPGFPPAWAVADYVDPVRAMLLAHKEHGRLALARPLGSALGRSVLAAALAGPPFAPTLVVPVPSRPVTVRHRGHDPVLRMARWAVAAARSAGIDARLLRALKHSRRVADQAGLDRGERWRNLHRSLRVNPRAAALLSGANVIVVDDVLTTGATIVEACRAINAAVDASLAAAVVAATVRRMSLD